MGVLGLFISAKEAGYIFTIKPLIEKLNKQGFRMSDKVIQRILKEAGEY